MIRQAWVHDGVLHQEVAEPSRWPISCTATDDSREAIASSDACDTSPPVTHAFEAPKWNQLASVPGGRRTPRRPVVAVDNLHMVATMMQFLARQSSSDGGWTQLLPGKARRCSVGRARRKPRRTLKRGSAARGGRACSVLHVEERRSLGGRGMLGEAANGAPFHLTGEKRRAADAS